MPNKKLSFAVFGNFYDDKTTIIIKDIIWLLGQRGADIYIEEAFLADQNFSNGITGVFNKDTIKADYVIALGGDGTFLRAASYIGSKEIPIIGVNLGRLGFLVNTKPEELSDTLNNIYAKKFSIDKRTVIKVATKGEKDIIQLPYALNDISILKKDDAAMITIHTSINGEPLANISADGLIVCTPTGSTAYSLSNGGPILVPHSGNLCLTPIAPHSLNIRPLVFSDDVVVDLKIDSRSHNYLVAIDGRSTTLREGSELTISKAAFKINVVKQANNNYFDTLRKKLMWGADLRSITKE